MGKKSFEVTFLGERFVLADKATTTLFENVKNNIGRGKLIAAKNEKGTLTVEVINSLVEASKKKDPRLGLREDGVHKCSFFHSGNGGQIKAQAWTLTDRETSEVKKDRDGNPVIAGPCFVTSIKRLEDAIENEAVRNSLISNMRAETVEVIGKSAEEVSKSKVLIGFMCGFHRNFSRTTVVNGEKKEVFPYRDIARRTTGVVEAITQLKKLAAYIEQIGESSSRRDEEADAFMNAKNRKFEKGRRGGNSGGDFGSNFQFNVQFGSTTFGARTEGEARLYKALVDEFKGRELEFSKLSVDELVSRGVNPNVAPVLTRRVRQSLESSATIGERAAESEEKERREKIARRDRREKVQKHRRGNISFEGEDDEK